MKTKKKVNQPTKPKNAALMPPKKSKKDNFKGKEHKFTKEDCIKGAEKANEVIKQKKVLRDDLLKYFGTKLGAANYEEMINNFGKRLKEANIQDMAFLRDTLGQKPAIEVNADLNVVKNYTWEDPDGTTYGKLQADED